MKAAVASLLLLTFAACGGGDEVEFGPPRVVPASKRPTLWGASTKDRLGVPSMAPAAKPAAGAAGGPRGDTPAGWESLPANPQRFRNAVWRVIGEPDTDCYLTVGVGGGVEFNLKRWYEQQFGKDRTPSVETLAEIPFCGRRGRLVELEGAMGQKQGWAALIAFFFEGQQVTSLKFTGPAAVVTAQRAAFLALARSIRLDGGAATEAPAIEPGQPLPADHQPVSVPAPEPVFTADTPDGWAPKQGSRRMLHHTFGTESELYVSQLGGTLRQTLDIWRFELQLEAMTDAEFAALPKALFLGDDAVLMDLAGDWRGMTGAQIDSARVVVAARQDGDAITFCKLVGPDAEVAAQRDAFVRFCGSVRRR